MFHLRDEFQQFGLAARIDDIAYIAAGELTILFFQFIGIDIIDTETLLQVIAVGDGANDLNMLGKAGLGIAFHAKPKVKESAQQAISTVGLDGILYFLGFKDSFLKQ